MKFKFKLPEASLTSRLLFGFILITGLVFWLMMDKVVGRVERQYLEALEEPMVDMANVMAELIARDITPDGKLDLRDLEKSMIRAKNRVFRARIYSMTKTKVDMDVCVTDADGTLLFDSLHPDRVGQKQNLRDVMLVLKGRYGARSTREDDYDSTSSIMFVSAPIRHKAQTVGVVSVGKPQKSTYEFQYKTRLWLKKVVGLLILCMVLGSFLLARWTTRPIRRLTDYAKAISRGERPPVPQLHGSEMRTLRTAFESMRDVLENRDYVERYVQTLTHELKSPVAAIRGASELLQEDMPEAQQARFLQNIQGESIRLQNLLDKLLMLASLEKRKALEETTEIDLSAMAREVCDHFTSTLQQRGLKLDCWIEDGVKVNGDAFLLHTALNNLVQNAVDFSPADTSISIGLKEVDGQANFIVEDEGSGLPDYAQERVFERFYSLPRPESGRKSSGLGLCFVKEAALLHGGSVVLENRDGRSGARAVFQIPVA